MPLSAPLRPAFNAVQLADALRPSLLRISRLLRLEAQKTGVSAGDAILLGRIKATPGAGVSALADLEQTSRPTMSSHLKRLEAAGFVTRGGDAEDGRRSGFTITLTGERKLEQIRTRRNDWLARRLAKLAPEERERIVEAAQVLAKLSSMPS